jgi:hypothetical protein
MKYPDGSLHVWHVCKVAQIAHSGITQRSQLNVTGSNK